MPKILILILTLVCSTSAFSQRSKSLLLRFDGFYETKCYREKDDDEDSQGYLRFYANGKVISTVTDCDTTGNTMNEWFNTTARYINAGRYRLNGRKLIFSTKGNGTLLNYWGRVTKKSILKLRWKNPVDGWKGRERYHFIIVSDLK